MFESYIHIVEILGTFSFAVSGTSVAMKKKLDIFGILIISFVTSIGGGTLRDIMLGNTPVAWLRDATTINVILASTIGTVLFGKFISKLNVSLFLFDSLGLGLFTFIGIQKGMDMHFSNGVCVAIGMLSGCFGGVIRDTLLNEIPLVFRKEIYASTCILGGAVYFLLHALKVDNQLSQTIGIATIVLLRIIVVRFNLSLPNMYKSSN
ncbi:MAG: trimeric intracellular cation channel family protein [Chitinophagaceae bacterium]|jgi:uncharacterized membrane protein YeiH|nr:trimeric intracellular cation channel family protein [Chitinophagaceae bacterium]